MQGVGSLIQTLRGFRALEEDAKKAVSFKSGTTAALYARRKDTQGTNLHIAWAGDSAATLLHRRRGTGGNTEFSVMPPTADRDTWTEDHDGTTEDAGVTPGQLPQSRSRKAKKSKKQLNLVSI